MVRGGLETTTKISLDHAHDFVTTPKMNIGGTIRVNPCGLVLLALAALVLIYMTMGSTSLTGPSTRTDGGGQTISMKQLLAVSIEVAKRGGREVKRIREQAEIGEKSKGKTQEGANNPVTDGDMLSHRAMYYSILKAFPHLNVISEEHDPQPIDMSEIQMPAMHDEEVDQIIQEDMHIPVDELDVWIDPLDATQEYTENLLHFVTTMVCVAVRGKPVMGVIHKPFVDNGQSMASTAWGWAGPDHVSRIVSSDVEHNKPSAHRDLALSRIIVSRSHAGSVHDVAENVFGPKANVTPAGGAGYKSWEVIKGNQDVYVHVTLIKKWDICAGAAILQALGGRLSTLRGQPVDYSGKPAHERNEGGVIATMHDHDSYVDALKDVKVDNSRKKKP